MRKSRLMPALDLRDVPGGADEPVQIYPEDDARSLLPPHVGGYGDEFGGPIEGDAPDDEVKAKALDALKPGLGTAALDAKTGTRHMPGLDLRDPTVDATMGEPTILSRTPASAPPLRAALRRLQAASGDGEIPAGLESAIAGIGGVADRAQAAMDGPGQVPPGSLKGQMAQVVMGGARKPLAPAGGAPDPRMEAVKQYVSEKRAPRDDVAVAEDKSNLANLNANLGEAGATIGAALGGGRPDTSFYDRLRQGAGAPVASAEKRAAVVRQALLDKRKGDAEFAQNATQNELEREKLRIAGRPKPTSALDDALTQSEIDKNKASAAKLGRHGAGGESLGDQKKRLEIEHLQQTISGEDPKKVAAADSSAARMTGLINELRDLHSGKVNPATGKREGGVGTELTGGKSERMGQLMTQIRIEAKNLAELGALSGPDMKLMEDMTGADPSSLGANLKGMFGVDNTETNLTGLERWAANAAKTARDVYGPKGKQAAAPSAEMVKMIAPDGRPRMVPTTKVQAALAAGGKMAQ